MLYVSDTVLYTRQKNDICSAHIKTKEKPRLTDKAEHPVTVTKVSKKEMKKLWK